MDAIVRTERWAAIREDAEETRPTGYDPAMPWDYVIYYSAYGVPGANTEWWKEHFEVPCLSTNTDAAAEKIMEIVDGHPQARATGAAPSQLMIGNGNDRPDKPDKRKTKEVETCANWNNGKGACAGDGPCPHSRQHVCKICGSHKHRAKDHRKGTYTTGSSKSARRRENQQKAAAKAQG